MQTPLTQTILACGILATTLASWAPDAAARNKLQIQDCPPAVTDVLSGDIDKTPLVSALEVIQTLPGVNPPGGQGGQAVDIRGLQTGGTTPGLTQLNGIPTGVVDRIEVLKGPQSALYGGDPLGDAIDIITRPQGTLSCRTVDNNLWSADKAYDGKTLTLPSNAYVIPYSFNEDLKLSSPINRSFGTLDGKFLSGRDWIRDVTAPFSLFCRSDEGTPTQLSIGNRFDYRLLGGIEDVNWLKGQSYIIDPYCYPLPEGGGYGCSSAAGSEPDKVLSGLDMLQGQGRIVGVERDGCEEWHPETGNPGMGCMQGEKRFPEKAVHYSDWIGGTLRDPFTGKPIDNAWVQVNPPSPTPFYDPGPRPGDEKGPTLTRTDGMGTYRTPLNGLAGQPVEIGVAKGCAQHTTVAIADSPKQAKQATPTPREKPPKDARICGPDLTKYVLDILAFVRKTWESWDKAEQEKRCSRLTDIRYALAAWDMAPFAPEAYDQLRVVPEYCAVNWPCTGTVEFMGHCLPSQVVNYIQWGAMNRLCGNRAMGIFVHSLRDTVSSLVSSVVNVVTLNASLGNPAKGKNYDGQYAMSVIGYYFMSKKPEERDFAERVMKRLLDRYVRESGDDWWKMDGTDCALICEETAGAELVKEKLDRLEWGFQWGSAYKDNPSQFSLKDEWRQKELERLRRLRKSKGK